MTPTSFYAFPVHVESEQCVESESYGLCQKLHPDKEVQSTSAPQDCIEPALDKPSWLEAVQVIPGLAWVSGQLGSPSEMHIMLNSQLLPTPSMDYH